MPTRKPTQLPISGRPIRLTVVGLGQISSSSSRPTRTAPTSKSWACAISTRPGGRGPGTRLPRRTATAHLEDLLTIDADVVDVLVPTPAHGPVVNGVLDEDSTCRCRSRSPVRSRTPTRMLAAAQRTGATLRVLEGLSVYPPLVRLHEVVRSGELGPPTGVHMKIVNTGRGGWDIPESSFRWQFEQSKDGRGMLVFDHGWHQLAIRALALRPDPAHLRVDRQHAGRTRHRAAHHARRAVDARVGARQRCARRARHHARARYLFPIGLLLVRRTGRGHRRPRVRPLQPRELVRHPGAVGRRVCRRPDPRVPRGSPTIRPTRSRARRRTWSTCSPAVRRRRSWTA